MPSYNAALDMFLLQHGGNYPYNDRLVTRNRIYSKWLLVETASFGCITCIDNANGSRRNVAIPSTTFNDQTVQHLILTKQALPAPNVVSEVLDYMASWGHEYDSEWHAEVVHWISYLLNNSIQCTQEELFFDLIEFKVKSLIYEYIGINEHLTATQIYDLWEQQFRSNYYYSGVRDFKVAATQSFTTVMIQVQAYLTVQSTLYNNAHSVPTPVSPESSTRSVTVKDE